MPFRRMFSTNASRGSGGQGLRSNEGLLISCLLNTLRWRFYILGRWKCLFTLESFNHYKENILAYKAEFLLYVATHVLTTA